MVSFGLTSVWCERAEGNQNHFRTNLIWPGKCRARKNRKNRSRKSCVEHHVRILTQWCQMYFLSPASTSFGSVVSVSHMCEQFYDTYLVKIEVIAPFQLPCSVWHGGFLLSLPSSNGECFWFHQRCRCWFWSTRQFFKIKWSCLLGFGFVLLFYIVSVESPWWCVSSHLIIY